MLTVKPIFDITKIRDILNKHNIDSKTAVILEAVEKENELGYVVVKEEDKEIKILAFDISDCVDYNNPSQNDTEISEYLIRSAGSYALNREITTLSTQLNEFSNIWNKFNFVQNNHKYQIELTVLFKKCKNCSD